MLALRKLSPGAGELSIEEVPRPEPGAGEARIAVTAAGICGTDLHLLHGQYPFRPPVTLGHEVAGFVDAVGSGVDLSWLGALVAPETAFSTCGSCRWCRTGRPMLCSERLSIGSGVNGGFASHVVVPARNLHRMPAWVSEHAAALAEPLACVCNALCDPGVIDLGDRVVVLGAGAVGILAAQVSRAAGGHVTLVGTASDAHRLGVAGTLSLDTSSIDAVTDRDRLLAEAAARKIDVVVECAGAPTAIQFGLNLLRPQGRYVQIGLVGGDVSVPFGEIVVRELSVRSAFGSSPASWLRMERILAAHLVELDPLISDVLPLADWRTAVGRFERRQGIKTVFDPRLSSPDVTLLPGRPDQPGRRSAGR